MSVLGCFYWGSFWRNRLRGGLPDDYFLEVYTDEVPRLFLFFKPECKHGLCDGVEIDRWPLIFKDKEPTVEEIDAILLNIKQALDACLEEQKGR